MRKISYKSVLRDLSKLEQKQAIKNIKLVPKKMDYKDLSLVLKLAYMIRLLKKAKAFQAWSYNSGSLLNKHRVFELLDPETHAKASLYGV